MSFTFIPTLVFFIISPILFIAYTVNPFCPAVSGWPFLQCLICLDPMDLDSSGLQSTLFSDTSHLTSERLYTPNSSCGQSFNQNTALLMDHMYDVHMTPNSSPMVSVSTVICISKFFLSPSEHAVLPYGAQTQSCIGGTIDGHQKPCLFTITTYGHVEDKVHEHTVSFINFLQLRHAIFSNCQ